MNWFRKKPSAVEPTPTAEAAVTPIVVDPKADFQKRIRTAEFWGWELVNAAESEETARAFFQGRMRGEYGHDCTGCDDCTSWVDYWVERAHEERVYCAKRDAEDAAERIAELEAARRKRESALQIIIEDNEGLRTEVADLKRELAELNTPRNADA